MTSRRDGAVLAGLGLAAVLALTACSPAGPVPDLPPTSRTQAPAPGPSAGSPSAGPTERAAASQPARQAAARKLTEPTTTNTLPPPPVPRSPAPSAAGRLTARDLPVPRGWETVVREGGMEEGYAGNGSWVHGRDPRYAARDVVTLGCAEVTRDDYPDPVAALEGTYERNGQPGIGLVLQFADNRQAATYYRVYRRQIRACRTSGGPVTVTELPSIIGLIDHRRSTDGDWTEVGRVSGPRLTLVILSDPGHRRGRAASEGLLRQIRS